MLEIDEKPTFPGFVWGVIGFAIGALLMMAQNTMSTSKALREGPLFKGHHIRFLNHNGHDIGITRLRTPGGWLIYSGRGYITYVPDADHEWK